MSKKLVCLEIPLTVYIEVDDNEIIDEDTEPVITRDAAFAIAEQKLKAAFGDDKVSGHDDGECEYVKDLTTKFTYTY